MSSIAETAAKAHLRLAEGFIMTADIEGNPTEHEVRNAFSRLYYALFHVSKGYLWANGFDVGRLDKKHGRLHNEMERCIWWFRENILWTEKDVRLHSRMDAASNLRSYGKIKVGTYTILLSAQHSAESFA